MRLLYVTAVWYGFNSHNMHVDFINEAVKEGHSVTVLALSEKRNKENTRFFTENKVKILVVKCGNIQKTNKYEKVISSITANGKMVRATKKFLKNESVDLVVWSVSTTLIFFGVRKITKFFHAKQYLLLKEYWPQDPTDLGAMKENGVIFKILKSVEKKMLEFANRIGTCSEAGIDYVLSRYPIDSKKCEVCPNCEQNIDGNYSRDVVFQKYGLNPNKTTFVYGGNIGLSQGPNEIISNLKACDDDGIQFIFFGSGTEYSIVKNALSNQCNVFFNNSIDYLDFFEFASCCDCGLIFLFKDYTVPNIPGKLNTYLNCEIPILACVDRTTDLGMILSRNNVGLSVYSDDPIAFKKAVETMKIKYKEYKTNCKKVLLKNYIPSIVVTKIVNFYKSINEN